MVNPILIHASND